MKTEILEFGGVVLRGAKRGTALGYPTANITLADASVSGIYVAEVLVGGKTYHAGVFADAVRKVLEAYLIDFDGDLYGKTIAVRLLIKLRENQSFENDERLKMQIAQDVASVREYFATIRKHS